MQGSDQRDRDVRDGCHGTPSSAKPDLSCDF